MVEKRVRVPENEWNAGCTIAIRKYLPANVDPTQVIHQSDGSCIIIYDDEPPKVAPALTVVSAPPPSVPPVVPQVSEPSEISHPVLPPKPPEQKPLYKKKRK